MPKLDRHLLGSVEVHRSPLKHVDFNKSFPVTADLKVKGQRMMVGERQNSIACTGPSWLRQWQLIKMRCGCCYGLSVNTINYMLEIQSSLLYVNSIRGAGVSGR